MKPQQKVLSYVRELHRSSRPIDDAKIDKLLGIRPLETQSAQDRLLLDHGDEQTILYDGTPYEVVREALHRLKLKRGDVLYDLGSGYGRVVLWGAIVSPAAFRGIELAPHRHRTAERAARGLGLFNAEFRLGNVKMTDIADGSAFFLFDPFFPSTLRAVNRVLSKTARYRKLRIASYWGTGDFFGRKRWLKELPGKSSLCDRFGLRIFAST